MNRITNARFSFTSLACARKREREREREREGKKWRKKKTGAVREWPERCDESSSMGPRDWRCARARKRWSRKEAGSLTTSAPLRNARGENHYVPVTFISAARGAAARRSLPRSTASRSHTYGFLDVFHTIQITGVRVELGEYVSTTVFYRGTM